MMADALLAPFRRAFADPASVARSAERGRVVRTLGLDVPRELILAAGLLPVRMVAGPPAPTPRADALMGAAAMSTRGKLLLEQLLDPEACEIPLLITHADEEQPQIFAALRELRRLGQTVPSNVHFLDLLHIDRASSHRYNGVRLRSFSNWLERISGSAIGSDAVAEAVGLTRGRRAQLDRLAGLRRAGLVTGTDALRIIGSAAILPPDDHARHLAELLAGAEAFPPVAGLRVFVAGSPQEDDAVYRAIEAAGALIVGERHGWDADFIAPHLGGADLDTFAAPALRAVARVTSPLDEAGRTAKAARACGAEFLVHVTVEGDEAAPWDVAALRGEMKLLSLRTRLDAGGVAAKVASFLAAGDSPEMERATNPPAPKAKPAKAEPTRSRKSLESVATFGAFQREWFASVRREVEAGAPFAVVNANAPQEILRALGIPFVVNQWWASIVAAKQQSRRYLAFLAAQGYPTNVEAYSAQGLAAAFDQDGEQAPWGGLPRPDFLHAVASSDPSFKIFDAWARTTGAECFVYERTLDPRFEIGSRWWEDLPEKWDETLEPERLDLMVDELRAVIATLEAKTGRLFCDERFREVMDLVNEQEGHYRRTRDLIARTVPVPISIVDSMPATMVPQWHRGTVWARDAARAFYDEVKARVDAGLAAAPNERIRLMWVGRGLWSDMAFYQKWEESHGAVFVWSMYLALAADGYIRSLDGGRDPMRALAARFITMGDELRMPTWAGPWHVHEAETHAVDGAVALADADPFVLRALREAGVPVIELAADNFSRDPAQAAVMEEAITAFIEGPAAARAERRRKEARVRA
jgi:benzoyl-CoA reductase/2-hydroxyglutaryl-CoA dehydratase subunit BcrC/BadD/HgdB